MSTAVIEQRVAGAALLLSVAAVLVGLGIAGAQGRIHGLAAAFRGVEGIGEAASALSLMGQAGFALTVLQLIGFTLLAVRLGEAGGRSLATVALVLFIFSACVMVIEGSFQATVTAWAGRHWQRTGNVPELFEALRFWVQHVQLIYVFAYLAAMAAFSWAVVRTAILPEWVGWASLGWSGLALVLYYGLWGAPVVIAVFPLLFGIALLRS